MQINNGFFPPREGAKRKVIVGNAVGDPELRFGKQGTPFANLTVAVNNPEDKKAEATFFEVVSFKGLAENVAESVRKGDRVLIVGNYELEEYTDKNDVPRVRHKILADDVAISMRWNPAASHRAERKQPQLDEGEDPF